MAVERVSDMTVDELERMIDTLLEKKLRQLSIQQHNQPIAEVLKTMRANVWTPPPGAKSSLELLREDRDR